MTRKKKVVLLSNMSYLPEFGGVENSLRFLSNEYRRMGYIPLVFSGQSRIKPRRRVSKIGSSVVFSVDFRPSSYLLFNFVYFPFAWLSTLKRVLFIKRRYKVDAVIVRNQFMCLFLNFLFRRTIFLAPGFNYVQSSSKLKSNDFSIGTRIKFILNVSLDYVAIFTSTRIGLFSENMVEQLHRIIPKFIKKRVKDKVFITKPGVDFGKFTKTSSLEKEALKSGLGFSSSDFVILCVGRFVQAKGFHIAIQSLAHLRHIPYIKLLLVGDGPMFDEYRELAESLGLSHRVSFLGSVTDTSTYYQLSDMFLMSSIYEPLGQTILEAAASSLPIVAFDSDANEVTSATSELLGSAYFKVAQINPQSLALVLEHAYSLDDSQMKLRGEMCRNKIIKYTWRNLSITLLDKS